MPSPQSLLAGSLLSIVSTLATAAEGQPALSAPNELALPPASGPALAVTEPPPTDRPASAEAPSAGYRNGAFYVRSPDDVFRLYIQGRVHADWLKQFGPGTSNVPPGGGVTNGFFLRRARLELGGEFFQTWQWQVGAELSAGVSIDNAAGQQFTPTCAPNASGQLPSPCPTKENPVEAPTTKPIPTDVFVNYAPSPWANLEVGQFFLPFTLENRISDNTTPFLERSLAVRNVGAPLQRDIGAMFWGESPDRRIYYAAAVVNGDGPNRLNVDTRYDVAGRVVLRPLVDAPSALGVKWAHVGVSAKGGSRDAKAVGYDLPSLTTAGGFAFWKPTYKDSVGRTVHVLPSGAQWGLAADVYVPIDRFDFTGEVIYASYDSREAIDGYQLSPFTERLGQLKGYGWYAEVSYWFIGDHDILGPPTYGRPIHVDLAKPQSPPRHGLQGIAKFEQIALTYDGAARAGQADAKTPNGDIHVDSLAFGLNYWATKHMRVGINYTVYFFPEAAPVTASSPGGPVQSASQRAVSPAQTIAAGADDSARDGGRSLHEVQVRVGVQF